MENTPIETHETASLQQVTNQTGAYNNNYHSDDQEISIVDDVLIQMRAQRKAKAKKDMILGGAFVAIGTALTLADIGFFFWGAIVFGGIQFVKGAMNYSVKD